MTPKTKIFLVSKDKKTIQHVDAVAHNGSPIEVDQVLSDIGLVEQYLDNSGITAGIVDIDPNPTEMLGELEAMTSANPRLCTVVVSETITQDLILSAMQAGARHFLQKGSVHNELSGVMGRLLTHNGVKRKTGSVLTVFSASGGCGATTVALNVANELRLKASKPVLVIDLDRCYGAASAYLDIKSDYGIDDVLSYEGKIDKHLIQTSSSSYKDDFHVLLSSAGSSNKPQGWGGQGLSDVLQACRQAYAYTVIDAPRMDEQTVKQLSELSDFTIVVFQLTFKDLKIIPLANRFKKRGPLVPIDDGKRALGTDTVYHIRSDWRNAINCLNTGKPLAETAPHSGMRKDFLKLVNEIQLHSE
ncbi:MAG: AAA family ATPase [Planctomycetota bacterium]|jgi:pilus assembly protein CpaE